MRARERVFGVFSLVVLLFLILFKNLDRWEFSSSWIGIYVSGGGAAAQLQVGSASWSRWKFSGRCFSGSPKLSIQVYSRFPGWSI